MDTGAASLAAMNQHIYELGQAAPSAAALGGLAQALAAGQADLAQAATQLATGAVAPGAWAGAYGPASLPAVYARAQARPPATPAEPPLEGVSKPGMPSFACRCTRAASCRAMARPANHLPWRPPGGDSTSLIWEVLCCPAQGPWQGRTDCQQKLPALTVRQSNSVLCWDVCM